MGRQDVWRALAAMDEDESVRERLAAGDFQAVDGLELSHEEQMLVQDAASDLPDVVGFAHKHLAGVKYEDIRVNCGVSIGDLGLGGLPPKWQTALKYTLES